MVVFTELFQALKAALEEHDPGYLVSWWDWLRGRVDPDARYRKGGVSDVSLSLHSAQSHILRPCTPCAAFPYPLSSGPTWCHLA